MDKEKLGTCWCGGVAIVRDRVTDKEYCFKCSLKPDYSSDDVHLQLLESLLPLTVGDVVDCYQAGDTERYVGRGTILEVSMDLVEGGTPRFPVYRVGFEEIEDRWFTSICFKRVKTTKD